MKSIILFRHGKSEWNTFYDSDHNRPLAPRGIKAAKKMGVFLANKKQVPDFQEVNLPIFKKIQQILMLTNNPKKF